MQAMAQPSAGRAACGPRWLGLRAPAPAAIARPARIVAVAAQDEVAPDAEAPELTRLTLRKPVGLVFAQKPGGGPVFVDEIVPGGVADKTGKVKVGDILAKCSAVVLKAGTEGKFENEGYGERPYDNFERVVFDCSGQSFQTVMSALKSNNSRWGIMDVTLWLQRSESG